MAAAMNSCMRRKVIHVCGILRSNRQCLSIYAAKTNTACRILSINPKYSYATLTFMCKRHFCEKAKGTITDDILKDRVVKSQTESGHNDTHKTDENAENNSKTKEKGFYIFGKFISATTLGFWVFGLMMTSFGFSAISVMGIVLVFSHLHTQHYKKLTCFQSYLIFINILNITVDVFVQMLNVYTATPL